MHNLFRTKRAYYLLNKDEKMLILAKLLLCEISSSRVNKMGSSRTKRTYLLNKGEKRIILQNSNSTGKIHFAKRVLVRSINWEVPRLFKTLINLLVDTIFYGQEGHLLNKGEKTPCRKIVILAKLLLCIVKLGLVRSIKWEVPRLFEIFIIWLVDTICFRRKGHTC